MKKVRTRFAPSPTGLLHVGGVRTALFAWLVARQNSGSFILRLEDTDKQREVEGSEDHIMKTLKTLGLDYDEGPDKGGDYGPYRQSERLDIYKDWGNRLIEAGRAYADPYSPEEVEDFRNRSKAAKKAFLFREYRPKDPPKWDGTKPLRFLSIPKDYAWHDEIMGDLQASSEAVDDFILIKSDGYPTYNFAHIIDDHLMEISHVIRAQEFLASVPRYLNLYEALEIKPPQMATVPFVLAPNGKRKLSKRDGAKDVLEYIDEGYLPAALINFMASLGWNDGSEQEIYDLDELVTQFKLSQVQRSPAKFDDARLIWMNGAHIRNLPLEELFKLAASYWPPSAKTYPEEYKKQVLGLVQERLKYLSEIPDLTSFFFADPTLDTELIKNDKRLGDIPGDQLKTWLVSAKETLAASDFSQGDIAKRLNGLLDSLGQKPAVLFSLIRIATTQSPASPGLFETIEVLGRARVLKRLDQQIAGLG